MACMVPHYLSKLPVHKIDNARSIEMASFPIYAYCFKFKGINEESKKELFVLI